MRSERLVAVTPARNEEKFIARCILSVANQSYPVTIHVIVDDWSNDRTRMIANNIGGKIIVIPSGIERGIKAHGIRPHIVTDLGIRKATELVHDWKYCLVLDGDTWCPSNYCETIIAEMERNPRLVIGGARFLRTPSGLEIAPKSHVRGSNHIVRRDFYNKSGIGYRSLHGEIMLERIASIMGFETRTFPITAFEGRPTGITLNNPALDGLYRYKLGYPILPFLFALRGLRKKSFLELFGWIYAKLHHEREYFQASQIKILHKRYLNTLFRRFIS
jgi:glycosyltransferase involved in cell wall biosynthesis